MRSTSWRLESVRNTPPTGMTAAPKTPVDVKLRLWLPMNKWSYSTATEQCGGNANSKAVPTTPPQRVSLAESNSAPVAVTVPRYLSSVTAAPPFTYQRTLFQAYPTWPVNRPNASILELLVQAGMKPLTLDPFKSPQSPPPSEPNHHPAPSHPHPPSPPTPPPP